MLPLGLRSLSRTPGRQARSGELDLSLLALRGRTLALVVAMQNQNFSVAKSVAEYAEHDLLSDLVIRLDRAVDAELEQAFTELTAPGPLAHDLNAT